MKLKEKSLEKSLEKKIKKSKSELCIECQECCKILRIPIGQFPTSNTRDFYAARGIKIISFDFYLWLVLPHTCAQLTPQGCKIYEDRPLACRAYDGRTDPVVNCKWKELDDKS